MPIYATVVGQMATDQVHPGNKRVGTFGHGPMPYSSLFILLFVGFLTGAFLLVCIL